MKKSMFWRGLMLLACVGFLPAVAQATPPPTAWTSIYDSGLDDMASCCGVAVDSVGNIIVAGTYRDMALNTADIRIIKYNANGVILWNRLYDSGGFEYGTCCGSLLIDSGNNIIITGSSSNSGTPQNIIFVAKYDSAGNQLWNNTSVTGSPTGAKLDSADNVVIAASTYNSYSDTLIVKYASSGAVVWTKTVDNLVNNYPSGIAVDSNNNVIVTGSTNDYMVNNSNIYVNKYSALDGTILWFRSYDSGNQDNSSGVDIDSNDNIIIGGSTQNPITFSNDALALKYDTDGTLLWNRSYISSNYAWVVPFVDSANNIIFVGGVVLKYDAAGTLLWDKVAPGWFSSAVVDSGNNIIFTGGSQNMPTMGGDYLTVKYDSNGNELWSASYDRGGSDGAQGIALDKAGNAIVTGTSSNGLNSDIVTILYGVPIPTLTLDIILNKTSFTAGETVIATVHVTNDSTPDKVEIKAWAVLPNGAKQSIQNVASQTIPANADFTMPLYRYTFTGNEPAGTYQIGGRFLEIVTGDQLAKDIESCTFVPTPLP